MLAEPYLRGCRARRERGRALRGWWLDAGRDAGFFAGYLISPGPFRFLSPQPPECLVFARVEPGSGAHARLVAPAESLLRKTAEYIGWLTHRPPRFAFFEQEMTTLVRHQGMGAWPEEKRQHLARNFFIESLAWLVRSGLVRRLLEEAGAQGRASERVRAAGALRDSRPDAPQRLAKTRRAR